MEHSLWDALHRTIHIYVKPGHVTVIEKTTEAKKESGGEMGHSFKQKREHGICVLGKGGQTRCRKKCQETF